MTILNTNSLKLYKNKLENYISALPETASESDIDSIFSPPHKYTFEIYTSDCASNEGYSLLSRINVEQNNKRLAFENIDYSNIKKSKAIINTSNDICNVSISNTTIDNFVSYDYSVAYPLRGNGQCLSIKPAIPFIFTLDKIASLSSISFFPSWNRYGVRAGDFNGNRYCKSVRVKVLCDDEEIFNNVMTGLVANDRVYVVFDTFNQCHLEKINVSSAKAFANY